MINAAETLPRGEVDDCNVNIYEIGFELVDDPPYSPDLPPSNYNLFLMLRQTLGNLSCGNDQWI